MPLHVRTEAENCGSHLVADDRNRDDTQAEIAYIAAQLQQANHLLYQLLPLLDLCSQTSSLPIANDQFVNIMAHAE